MTTTRVTNRLQYQPRLVSERIRIEVEQCIARRAGDLIAVCLETGVPPEVVRRIEAAMRDDPEVTDP